ncbi:MAG: hypothetical protein NT171_03835 [Planctomycetota bacterium]|nr:hypothetical protein [Planctomycetota bacterium]
MPAMRHSPRRLPHLWLFVLLAIALPCLTERHARSADVSIKSDRACSQGELDSLLMAWFAPLPASGDAEIFSTFDRPKKSRAEIEKDVRVMIARDRERGDKGSDADWELFYQINVEGREEWYSKPVLKRERFRTKGTARRCDYADKTDGQPITPQSPFETTSIQPGNRADGDRRYYRYEHWNATESLREYYGKYGPGSAMTTEFHNTDDVRDIWEELVGVDRMLLEILAVEVCELPKPPLTKVPEARELPLDPKKIASSAESVGDFRLW